MRTILTICAAILLGGGVLLWRWTQPAMHFGEFSGAPKAEVAELIEKPKDYVGKTVMVEGTISQQCKTMGCFFYMPSGKKMLRVDLQEIAMHAPMKEGHPARVEGHMVPFSEGFQLFASAIEFQ